MLSTRCKGMFWHRQCHSLNEPSIEIRFNDLPSVARLAVSRLIVGHKKPPRTFPVQLCTLLLKSVAESFSL